MRRYVAESALAPDVFRIVSILKGMWKLSRLCCFNSVIQPDRRARACWNFPSHSCNPQCLPGLRRFASTLLATKHVGEILRSKCYFDPEPYHPNFSPNRARSLQNSSAILPLTAGFQAVRKTVIRSGCFVHEGHVKAAQPRLQRKPRKC